MSTNEITEQPKSPEVEIYTDGACSGNPGPGGWGVVLVHPKKRLEEKGGFRLTTNNRMEIYAAIKGLELLKKPGCMVTIFSDSEYLVNTISKRWYEKWKRNDWWLNNKERVQNSDLWKRLLELCEKHQVQFQWVRGHNGHVENERCDQLAQEALSQENLPADEGYENKPDTEGERRPSPKEGEPCRRCGTPLIKQKPTKKPKGDSYQEYYLWCPKCHVEYQVPEAKRLVEQPPSLFCD